MAKRQVRRMIDTIKRGQQPYDDNAKIYKPNTRCALMKNGRRTVMQFTRFRHDWLNHNTNLMGYVDGNWVNITEILVWP